MIMEASGQAVDFALMLEESGYQPLGIIPPCEVAQMANYLMSDLGAHINGVVIPINAGDQHSFCIGHEQQTLFLRKLIIMRMIKGSYSN